MYDMCRSKVKIMSQVSCLPFIGCMNALNVVWTSVNLYLMHSVKEAYTYGLLNKILNRALNELRSEAWTKSYPEHWKEHWMKYWMEHVYILTLCAAHMEL